MEGMSNIVKSGGARTSSDGIDAEELEGSGRPDEKHAKISSAEHPNYRTLCLLVLPHMGNGRLRFPSFPQRHREYMYYVCPVRRSEPRVSVSFIWRVPNDEAPGNGY